MNEQHLHVVSLEKNKKSSYIKEGIEEAISNIKKRYEDAPDPTHILPYHNSEHTAHVVRRTIQILSTIRNYAPDVVTEDTLSIAKLAAYYHDVVQNAHKNIVDEGEFQKIIRKPLSGQNEKESAEEAVGFMEECNKKELQEVFTYTDKKYLVEAITSTVAVFNPVLGGIEQPHLSDSSNIVSVALALADIGSVGMDGPVIFKKDGDALFREENIDILHAVQDPHTITDNQKDYFKIRILAWSKGQISFAVNRKMLFENEINRIPVEARSAIRNLFNKFDQSIEKAKENYEKREVMTFDALVDDMGYRINTNGLQ